MAGGETLTIDDYEFTVKPRCRWRRYTCDFFPYWQASKPKFTLIVKRVGMPTTASININMSFKFGGHTEVPFQVTIPLLDTDKRVSIEIGGYLLGYAGDTLIAMPSDIKANQLINFETIYSFHTTPKVWITLAIIAGLLAGILGAIGQWIISILSNGNS